MVAALMWLGAETTPRLAVALPFRLPLAAALAAASVTSIVGARVALHRARTTWHPTGPERTTFGRGYREYAARVRRWL